MTPAKAVHKRLVPALGAAWAIGMIVLGCTSALAEPLQAYSTMSGASREREPRYDMALVRRRTAEYEAASKPHEAELAHPMSAREAAALIDRAQAKVGARPGLLGRLAFPKSDGAGVDG